MPSWDLVHSDEEIQPRIENISRLSNDPLAQASASSRRKMIAKAREATPSLNPEPGSSNDSTDQQEPNPPDLDKTKNKIKYTRAGVTSSLNLSLGHYAGGIKRESNLEEQYEKSAWAQSKRTEIRLATRLVAWEGQQAWKRFIIIVH